MLSIIYQGNNKTIDLISTPNLIITGYEGLDQPLSETITLTNPYVRGSQYQRSQISDRHISFTFAVYDVENTRYKLMDVFKSGEKGVLTLKNEFREGQIECYFEEMTFGRFENPTTCTIFLRSPYPYFKGMEDIIIELDNAIELFVLEAYIPESGIALGEITDDSSAIVTNASDIELGLTIEITAVETTVNPVIYNETTNKYIGLNYTLTAGEKITITTSIGNKKITADLNGDSRNIINKLSRGSSFFQLQRGTNSLRCEADRGGETMIVYIKYRDEYEAI